MSDFRLRSWRIGPDAPPDRGRPPRRRVVRVRLRPRPRRRQRPRDRRCVCATRGEAGESRIPRRTTLPRCAESELTSRSGDPRRRAGAPARPPRLRHVRRASRPGRSSRSIRRVLAAEVRDGHRGAPPRRGRHPRRQRRPSRPRRHPRCHADRRRRQRTRRRRHLPLCASHGRRCSRWAEHMRETRAAATPTSPSAELGTPDEDITLVIDVEEHLATRWAAIRRPRQPGQPVRRPARGAPARVPRHRTASASSGAWTHRRCRTLPA